MEDHLDSYGSLDSTSTVNEREKLRKFKQILGLKWRTTSCVHSRVHSKIRICDIDLQYWINLTDLNLCMQC